VRIKRSERVDKCRGNETTGVKSGAPFNDICCRERIKNEIRLGGEPG